MTILDNGWTEDQARGLLDSLMLNGSTPHWKPIHLERLQDWCSSHEKDSTTIEAQLEFVAYELLNSFQAVGLFLKQAKTVEEAREAVQPYVRRLKADSWVLDNGDESLIGNTERRRNFTIRGT